MEKPQQSDAPYPYADAVNNPRIPPLSECALLLDIDGTLLDFAATPREVWVPPELAISLSRLTQLTSGALAMVSGRSLNDIDLIFAPQVFPAVGGHGAELRRSSSSETIAVQASPLDKELKRRLAALAKISPGILLEDKGYSLALHYRLAPHAADEIFRGVSAIQADMPEQLIEILPGKSVCEIKHSGFTKATGVIQLMDTAPFKGRRPIFLGDDVTDQSVFTIMPEMNGIAFAVGFHAAGVDGYFDGPSNVRSWLEQLTKKNPLSA